MPYENNTYISTQGREYTRAIFHNMFKNDGVDMDLSSVASIIGYMRGNNGEQFHQTLGLIKQFISGYSQKPASTSYDTGILICPECSRRDFMPFWEFVDFGFRNNNREWTSTVEPDKREYNVGGDLQATGYHIVSRIRCNSVTTCSECHHTVTGKYSSCRNPNCGSSDVVSAGCGNEFSYHSVVDEVKRSEWISLGRQETNTTRVHKFKNGIPYDVERMGLRPFFWRIAYQGPVPQGVILNDPITAFSYIPQLEIGYQTYDGVQKPYGYKCPESGCGFERYAPPFGEPYDLPLVSPSGFDSDAIYTKTGEYGQPLSSGAQASYNRDREEQRGGLVNNMGCCPHHTDTYLVPKVSIKKMPPSTWFTTDGEPLNDDNFTSWSGGRGRGYSDPDLLEAKNQVGAFFNEQYVRYMNAKPESYPISSLRRMFVQIAKQVCTKCCGTLKSGGGWGETYTENDNYFYSPAKGHTLECQFCKEWRPQYRRPATDNRMMENPSLYQIASPQPLSSIKGPQATILLDSVIAPDQALRQEQLLIWSGIKIPSQVGENIEDSSKGIFLCPNDAAYEAKVVGELRAKQLAEEALGIEIADSEQKIRTRLINLDGKARDGQDMRKAFNEAQAAGDIPQFLGVNAAVDYIVSSVSGDFVTITSPHLLKYRSFDTRTDLPGREWQFEVRTENIILALDDASPLGESAPGFTYVVCEGRSRECYRSRGTIIDVSPECVSYRNRDTGESQATPRTYPRWTQTPSYDVRPPMDKSNLEARYVTDDGKYLWFSDNHFAQDRYRINTYLDSMMPKSPSGEPDLRPRYHVFKELPPPELQEDEMQVTIFYECETCKKMYNIGQKMVADGTYEPGAAVTEYYRRRRLVDADGNVTRPDYFPQEALEAAQQREQDSITNLGVEDEYLQNRLGRGDGLSAKEMLENATGVVKI